MALIAIAVIVVGVIIVIIFARSEFTCILANLNRSYQNISHIAMCCSDCKTILEAH